MEILNWHYLKDAQLEQKKRQAEREDGQLLILPSDSSEEVGALSDPTQDLSSEGKDTEVAVNEKEKGKKNARKAKPIDMSKFVEKVAKGMSAETKSLRTFFI
ncbi:MAG: hypothetical protein IKX93_09845 [Bacteroidaceae bacterium]|nr:hypothetical protein [Bacteroidaceae bacterium]